MGSIKHSFLERVFGEKGSGKRYSDKLVSIKVGRARFTELKVSILKNILAKRTTHHGPVCKSVLYILEQKGAMFFG